MTSAWNSGRPSRRRPPVALAAGVLGLGLVVGCGGRDNTPAASAVTTAPAAESTTTASEPAGDLLTPVESAPTATTTVQATSTTTTSTTTSTTSTTTTSTTTLPPPGPAMDEFDLLLDRQVLGFSVEGREIVAERYGTPGDRRVLVIGVIHGNENAGLQIVDRVRDIARLEGPPPGIELWLVPSMNPDGTARQDRHNANEVDLNRNFPHNWGPIGEVGDGQYAGPGPASEPETQLMVQFIEQLRPDIAIWYHQDANLIIPSSGRDGRIRAQYAELTGLPLADCCAGGVYTGIAATWARNALADQGSVAFIVELPGGVLPEDRVETHSRALLQVTAEG